MESFHDVSCILFDMNGMIVTAAVTSMEALQRGAIWIASRDPAIDFLTDAVAVEATLLGLTIPLSFEIISRISERYESDVVTRQFVSEPIVRWMPHCLVANIGLAIVMKFMKSPGQHGGFEWRLVSWFGLLGFIFTTWMLFRFLSTLKKYIVNRQFVVDSLLNEARKSLS